jgi:hypothetical protein
MTDRGILKMIPVRPRDPELLPTADLFYGKTLSPQLTDTPRYGPPVSNFEGNNPWPTTA